MKSSKGIILDKTKYAFDYIKGCIIDGTYKPLTDLSESDIQLKLGISRTPVREAIKRLEQEQFVTIYPRKGTIVNDITFELVNSIYEIRLLNEPHIAMQAVELIDSAWLENIHDRFINPPKGMSEKDIRLYYINLDQELHSIIVSHSNNVFLKNMLGMVDDHNQRIRIRTSWKNTQYEKSISGHVEIIDSLRSKDQIRVRDVIRKHLENSRAESIKFLSDF